MSRLSRLDLETLPTPGLLLPRSSGHCAAHHQGRDGSWAKQHSRNSAKKRILHITIQVGGLCGFFDISFQHVSGESEFVDLSTSPFSKAGM